MKVQVEGKTEFKKFDSFMRRLVRVPHKEIKAALDAEKKSKQVKKKKSKAPYYRRQDKAMTQDEKRTQLGEILVAIRETQKEINATTVSLQRIGENLYKVEPSSTIKPRYS